MRHIDDPIQPDVAQGPRVYGVNEPGDEFARARHLASLGLSVREIARVTGKSRSRVQRLLSPHPAPRSGRHRIVDREVAIEAALAYGARYGELPTSVLWNSARAYARGPTAWQRYLEGWASVADPSRWQPWPHPSAIARVFAGGMSELCRLAQREIARREREGIPYLPVPPTSDRRFLARLEADNRAISGPLLSNRIDRSLGGPLDERPGPPSALRPVRVGKTDFGPMRIARCDERGTFGLAGESGEGKTSALWRVALNDIIDGAARVVLIERAARPMARGVEMAIGHSASGIDSVAVESATPLAFADDDVVKRVLAVKTTAQYARSTAVRPISLVCDDGHDLLPVLLDLRLHLPERLYLTIAWRPLGSMQDVALMRLCDTFMCLRVDSLAFVAAVARDMTIRRRRAAVAKVPPGDGEA